MDKYWVMVSDLHLTDKDRDSYRFGIFDQIIEIINTINKTGLVERILILGDVFDAKDLHPGKLVNRVVDGLASLSEKCSNLVIVHGNHDSLDSATPYLKFIEHIPEIRYYNTIQELSWEVPVTILPHTRTPLVDWEGLDFSGRVVLAHATVNGALAESMIPLESQIEPELFSTAKRCFSGDIHKAQEVGPVIYVGSPYDTRFNPVSHGGGAVVMTVSDPTLPWVRVPLTFPRRLVVDVRNAEEAEKALLDAAQQTPLAQIKIRFHVDQDNLGTQQAEISKIKALEIFKQSGFELGPVETVNEVKTQVKLVTKTTTTKFGFEEYCSKFKIEGALKDHGKAIMEGTLS